MSQLQDEEMADASSAHDTENGDIEDEEEEEPVEKLIRIVSLPQRITMCFHSMLMWTSYLVLQKQQLHLNS
jgi:hypothetical protein